MIRVVIPYGGNDPYRQASLDWVVGHLRAVFDDVTIGRCEGVWSKARAVTDALDADWDDDDVIVIHDGDVWIPELADALNHLDRYRWVVPHQTVYRMNADLSARVLDGQVPFTGLGRKDWDQTPYAGVVGGGCVALRYASYRSCPLDPRFEGWGQEDEAWGAALTRMYGQAWHGTCPLYHFWHPHPARRDRYVGSDAGEELRFRYWSARHDTPMMEALLAEIRSVERASD